MAILSGMFHMSPSFIRAALLLCCFTVPAQERPGPWQNDVHVYRVAREHERIATFSRAGVPALARLNDGRIVAAFQHFPENDRVNFDRIAVSFSRDEGRTWNTPKSILVSGMDSGLMRPFDPTLVPLPDGQVRLYFTSNRSRDLHRSTPAIYSAISSNAVDYQFEPGVRFAIDGRVVIDCAVALHRGVFHLFAPDNGSAAEFRAAEEQRSPPPAGGAYHATSPDGLTFKRAADLRLESFRWLGNAHSDGESIRFFGTGRRMSAVSSNGLDWKVDSSFAPVPGADPGAVKLKDGSWLLAVTGPPPEGRRNSERRGERPPVLPLMEALDANRDGVLDEREVENATPALRKLDQNQDGRIGGEELRRDP